MEKQKRGHAQGQRIRVFLSSEINATLKPIRKELYDLLADSDFFDPFAFEINSASSLPVPDNYLVPLRQSQAVVALIDNKNGATKPVLLEINEAKKIGLHLLVFFCSENSNKETELQKQIIEEGFCKFEIIDHFSDFPSHAYRSLLEDLTWVYCEKRESFKNTLEKVPFALPSMGSLEVSLEKEVTLSFKKTENDLRNYVLSESVKSEDTDSSFEGLFRLFLPVVLGDQHFDEKQFQKIEGIIPKHHPKNLRGLVALRLSAIRAFYSENLAQCVETLQKTIKKSEKQKNIPEWFRNDMAVDLRYVISLRDQSSNQFSQSNEGQKKLDNSPETLYFPVLDRLSSSIREDIIAEYRRIQEERPSTERYSNDETHFDEIASYFCAALFYGSILHLKWTRRYMIEMFGVLNQQDLNRNFYIQELKYLILEGKDEQIESLLRTSPHSETFASDDLETIGKCINNLPLESERCEARLLMMKHFGYFYSDSFFKKESDWLFNYARYWIASPNPIFNDRSKILDALIECYQRFNHEDFAEIALLFIEKYHLLAIDLVRYVDFSKLSTSRQERFRNCLAEMAGQQSNNHIDFQLRFPLIFFCRNATINTAPLVKQIKALDPDFYAGDYLLETDAGPENSKKQIEGRLRSIKYQNAKPTIRIIGDDDFLLIKEIIEINKVPLSSDNINEIVSAINETLLAPSQTPGTKCSALDLLNSLLSRYPQDHVWEKERETLLSITPSLYGDEFHGFIEKIERGCTGFCLNLSLLLLKRSSPEKSIQSISELAAVNKSSKIRALKSLSLFLKNLSPESVSETDLSLLGAFALSSLKEAEIDERYYAVMSLINLTRGPLKALALKALQKEMEQDSALIRLTIVQSLPRIDGAELFKKTIREKAKTDNHFLIRKIATEKPAIT